MKNFILYLLYFFISFESFSSELTIDDFSDSPIKEFLVVPKSDIETNLVNGTVSRTFYATNELNKSSDQIITIIGFDPKSFQIKVGDGKFSVSCPAYFTNTFLTLNYDVNLNLIGLSDYFEIIVNSVDHWNGMTLGLTDNNGNYESEFNGTLGPVIRFYLTNFNNTIDVTSITNLNLRIDFNTSSDFSLKSIKYYSEPKINSCPIGTDDVYTGVVGSILMGNVITNDYDPDGDFMYTVVVSQPIHGRLYMTTSGQFSYSHYGYTNLNDSFTYRLYDVDGCYDIVNVLLNIQENSCPVVVGETIEVPIGGVAVSTTDLETSLLANDYDPDGNRLSIEIVNYPIYGELFIRRDGSFIYTHNGGQYTIDSFTYKVTDSNGCSTLGTAIVNALPCGPCAGKLSELQLLYNGPTTIRVIGVTKSGNGRGTSLTIVANELIQPNDIILFSGEKNLDSRNGFRGTLGTQLYIITNGVYMTTIHTSCSIPIIPGDTYGLFTVISAKSKLNGFICE